MRIRTDSPSFIPSASSNGACLALPLFPPRQRKTFHETVLQEILQERVSSSRNRLNPRGVKRKMSNYPLRVVSENWTRLFCRLRARRIQNAGGSIRPGRIQSQSATYSLRVEGWLGLTASDQNRSWHTTLRTPNTRSSCHRPDRSQNQMR